MRSNSQILSFLLGIFFDSVNIPLALFFLFCFFRVVFRKPWIATLAWAILVSALVNLPHPQLSGVFVAAVFSALWLLAVTRFGLVVGMAMWFADRIFRAEIMIAPKGWYAGRVYLLLGAVAALTIYAFIKSLGKQPILSHRLLDLKQ